VRSAGTDALWSVVVVVVGATVVVVTAGAVV
jgi:hypothetical protein